jgi:hypothetical protein
LAFSMTAAGNAVSVLQLADQEFVARLPTRRL